MTYAAAADVTNRWGKDPDGLDPEIVTLIETRLADAERMINRRFKQQGSTLADAVSAGLDRDDVIQVQADAVLRLVRNPDGYQSETDGEYTYMLRNDLASGVLELTSVDLVTLGLNGFGMFVIVPTPVMPS